MMAVSPRRLAARCLVAALTAGCATPAAPPSLPELAVADAAFAPTLAAYSGSAVVAGNRVDLLLNGDEIFPAVLAAIRDARESVHYVQYSWGDGDISRAVAEAFAERCRAGVRVRIMVDGMGSAGLPAEHIASMRRAGCRVHVFRPMHSALFRFWRFNARDHRRILIIDGRLAITGGSGVNSKVDGRRAYQRALA